MAEIKTRILLKNDTLANWEAEGSVTLRKGEVGIAMLDGALAEVRVGGAADGSNTSWANSRKLRVEASQISGLIDTINTQINGIAQEYQLTAGTGDDLNKWFLQSRPLSGGDWTTVNTLDLTQLTGYALSTDVDALVGAVSAEALLSANNYTDTVVGNVSAETLVSANAYTDGVVADVSAKTLISANAYADAAVDALSIGNYMLTADFNALSNEIGLSAASASNPVVTKDDIADLAGAMHFRGAVTPTEGQTDEQAIATYYAAEGMTPAAGDIVIITTNSREYVYNGTTWIELGAEDLYATKAEVNTVSSAITADVDYLSGVIDNNKTELETLVGTVSAETLVSANAYTNSKIDGLSTTVDTLVAAVSAEAITSANAHTDVAIAALSIGEYALSADVDALVAAVSAATFDAAVASASAYTDAEIDALDIEKYALSADVTTLVATVSAEALVSANAYTDAAVSALSDYALSADVNTLVGAVSAETLVSANAYTDEKVAALSIDDYIKHGEVTSNELSGYFVFDCGSATYRYGEQAATEA